MKNKKKLNIFISSTYSDLQEHRERVIKVLKQAESEIEAMELWLASPTSPIEKCLKHLKKSNLLITIIAHRYGSLTEEGISFTEAEYEYSKNLKIDSLVFIIEDHYKIDPSQIDYDNIEKLLSFKKRLKAEHMVSFFTTPDDLAKKVLLSFIEYTQSIGYQRLSKNIKTFWKKLLKEQKASIPFSDWMIPINPNEDPLTIIRKIRNEINGIEKWYDYISDSYRRLEEDLKLTLKKIGCNPEKLKKIDYYENPFIHRDWEMITFFINRINFLKLSSSQIEIHLLEEYVNKNPSDNNIKEDLKKAQDLLIKEIGIIGHIID